MFIVVSLLKQVVLRFLTSLDQILENSDHDIHADGVPCQAILLISGNACCLDEIDLTITHTLQPETFSFCQPAETIMVFLVLEIAEDIGGCLGGQCRADESSALHPAPPGL